MRNTAFAGRQAPSSSSRKAFWCFILDFPLFDKIRLAIASKGKGKSGGARVITHFYVAQDTVFLLYIYDKSDLENISDSEIKALLRFIQ